MLDKKLIIRPSSLNGYPDCARRAAASSWPDIIEAAGYPLRERECSIGAAIGTGVHTAVAFTFTQWVDTSQYGSDDEANDRAIASLRYEAENGVIFDQASPEMNIAERQVRRMAKVYRTQVARKIKPVRVEKRFTVDIGGGWSVSGQADQLALEPGSVHDTKTGVIQRVNIAQVGTYSLLARTPVKDGGAGMKIEKIVEDYIPRVSIRKDQPPPIETFYPVDLAEQIAQHRITQVRADMTRFLETGDPQSFPANPASMLCGAKYCTAHGTKFCREHRGSFG